MTVLLQDGSAGLFDVLGRVFHAAATQQTAARTTVPTELLDIVTQFENVADDLELTSIIAGVSEVRDAVEDSGDDVLRQLQAITQDYVTAVVHDDVSLTSKSFRTALTELIAQMVANSESVDASAVTATAAAVGSPAGDGVVVVTERRGDGRTQEHSIAEVLTLQAAADRPSSLSVISGEAVNILSVHWPQRSGAAGSVSIVNPGSGLITGGGFDTLSTEGDLPKGWLLTTGTPGVQVKMTTPETQTITISGSPSTGYYIISWENSSGEVGTTTPLAYNAAQSAVQSALRKIRGLESVTVSTSGTSPNYTHAVTFLGAGGNVNQMTSINRLSGGTPQNEVQSITISDSDSGTFTITFDDTGSNPQITGNISYPPTASSISSALVALSNVGVGDVSVSGTGPWSVQFQNALGVTAFEAMTIDTGSLVRTPPGVSIATVREGGVAANAIQTLNWLDTFSGGTFSVRIGSTVTGAIAHNATSTTIDTAIENTGDYAVTSTGGPMGTAPVAVEFDGISAATAIPEMTVNTSALTGGAYSVSVAEITPGATGTNEVRLLRVAEVSGSVTGGGSGSFERQKITRSGTVSGGTFTVELTVGATTHTSPAIAYDARFWTICERLQAVFDLHYGAGVAAVIPANPSYYSTPLTDSIGTSGIEFVVLTSTFMDIPQIAVNSGSLTGGGSYSPSTSLSGSGSGLWNFRQFVGRFTYGSSTVDVTLGEDNLTSTLLTALQSILGTGNVTVTRLGVATYAITLIGSFAGLNVGTEFSFAVLSYLNDVIGIPELETAQNGGIGAVSEVQRITVAGSPSTGSFSISRLGSSATIAHNAAVATVQTALRTLPNLSGVTVSGAGPFPANTMDVTFPSPLGNVALLTADYSLLLYVVTQTQIGRPDQDEQFTITLTNSPISGQFTVEIDNGTDPPVPTGNIAYNASNASLKGLLDATGLGTFTVTGSAGAWTVTASGALATIDITVTGDAGTLNNTQPSATVAITQPGGATGSVTHATTVAGDPNVYAGTYAVRMESDGTTLTEMVHRLTGLTAETCYALNAWLKVVAASASGVVQFRLLDGIGGSVINDQQGTANSFTINASALTTGWQSIAELVTQPVFRTPRKMPPTVYLSVRFSTSPPSGKIVVIDSLVLTQMAEMYAGGPFIAAFGGAEQFRVGDEWQVTVTNDRAGVLHEWCNRFFSLAANRLLLPSNAAGAETIPDSVVS